MKIFKSEKAKRNVFETYGKLLDMWNVEKEERDINTFFGTTHVIICGDENKPPMVNLTGVSNGAYLSQYYGL